jgi:UMF1 family MFS transporter
MTTAVHFFVLAIMVGMVQGGTQALSRSLFASMIPRHRSSEFFAFFSVFERYAGVLGPAIFAFVIERTGSGRSAILAVAAFFVAGAAVLAFVNVERGRSAARAAGADLRPAADPRRPV